MTADSVDLRQKISRNSNLHRSLVVERDTHRPVLVNPRKLITGKQEINNYTRMHHQLRPLTQIGGEA